MIRALLIATVAATALGACTQYSDTPYRSANNPPGFVDRDRNGRDDRVEGRQTNPNNPPGFVDRDRNGRDDRVQGQQQGGYYDRNGVWRSGS